MSYRLVHCLCIALLALAGMTSRSRAADSISVAFWNVENLFDAVDDPGTGDDELVGWWTESLYQKKLENLAAVINQMNGGKGPDILGLAEVENGHVVNDLVSKLTTPDDYYIVHVEGHDPRGIDVALISRFPVKKVRSHYVFDGTRDILQVDLDMGKQPLTVLVNHWKSRYGGVAETAPWRLVCANRAYNLVRDMVQANPLADIIVMGDFNDAPTDESVIKGLHAIGDKDKVLGSNTSEFLYNADSEIAKPGTGSHWYKSTWEYLDQFTMSRGLLLDDGLQYVPGSLATFDAGGLLLKDGKPFRFGGKNDAERGYADHLPLVATLTWRRNLTGAVSVAPGKRLGLLGTLYYQTAGEARALYLQAYSLARLRLEQDLAKYPAPEKRAVVVDIDETVLDNSPYQAKQLLDGTSYPTGWQSWVDRAEAEPTPGSLAFLTWAAAQPGVEVFYITSRKEETEKAGTMRNLQARGFPNVDEAHVQCRTTERGKTGRRLRLMAAGYRIVLLIGDNLGDFSGAFEGQSPEARRVAVERQAEQFGRTYIMLPNPMYGDWEGAIYNYDYAQPDEALESARLKALRPD